MLLRNWRAVCVAATVVASLSIPASAQQGEVIEEIQETVPQQGTTIQERETQTPPQTRPGQRRDQTRFAGQAQGRQQGQLDNQALATWLLAGIEGEIKISEAAAQNVQNEEVKAFAQKMVEEHTKQAKQLRQIAMGGGQQGQPQPGQRQPGQPPRPGQSSIDQSGSERAQVSTQQPQPSQPGARTQPGQPRGAQPGQGRMMQSDNPAVALHQQIAEKCAQSKLQALQQAQGEEQAHTYVHGQVAAHMTMKDTLEVIGQKASGQLKQLVTQSQQTIEQHLQEAKQLEKQLMAQSQQQ